MTTTAKPLTKKRFMELMEQSYRQRAKTECWRPSELAMTLAMMNRDLRTLWDKTRKAQLTEAEVKKHLQLK